MTTSRLLSHELGHLFGSDHDGTVGKNPDTIFYRERKQLVLLCRMGRKIKFTKAEIGNTLMNSVYNML